MFIKGEIPFVRLLIPLILGIVAALLWPGRELRDWSAVVVAIGMVLFVLLLPFYKFYRLYRRRWLLGILIQMIVFFTGCILTIRAAEKYAETYFLNVDAEAFIISVREEPRISGNILRFEAAVEQSIVDGRLRNVSGKLLVAIKTDSLNPTQPGYGNRLIIPARHAEVDPPYNPAEFDYKAYLGNKQLYRQCFVNQEEVMLLNDRSGNKLIAFALQFRKELVDKFNRYLANKDAAALASTLILGYRSSLSKDVVSAYSKTGTLHILSVSGMHVAIVFIVLAFLMKPMNRYRQLRLLKAAIIISTIWFYALITGFSPSVCRAAMMLSFVVLGKTLNRNLNTYNLLAISAFLLLLYYPYNLVDVGFQLSYLAVIGLVFLQPKIYHLLYIKNKALDVIWNYSALSLAAQLATFPLSLYYFHQFPVYFLISNLLVVLPVALIMYAGILFLFIPWPALLISLGAFLNSVIIYTNRILFYMEDLPFASAGGIWISTYQYILIYLVIASIIWACLTAKKAGLYLSLLSILIFSLSVSFKIIKDEHRKELTFYSLRKNSALAYLHGGEAYLITDLAPGDRTLQFSVMPALESKGGSVVKHLNFGDSHANQHVKVNPDYLQFGKLRVFRWSKKMDERVFGRRIKTDIVLLSGSPIINIKDLKENAEFSVLLVDATNPEYKIRQWKMEASDLKVPLVVLKKSPAYAVNLDN